MTAALTDAELDAVLSGAAARLQTEAAEVALGAAPAPSFPTTAVLRIAAAVVLFAGVAAGAVAVSRHDAGDSVPAAFTDGQYGPEIVLRPVDDGDGNADTTRLHAEPGGGEVRVLSGASAVAYGAEPTADAATWRCYEFPSGSGTCGSPREPQLELSGTRGPDAQALVLWIPRDVVAVAFEAGDATRSWARPVDGIATFPFPATASASATATLVRADGTAVAVVDAFDETPTDAERVTALTPETLARPLAVTEPPAGFRSTDEAYVRAHGRRGAATGFGGPFVLQSFTSGTTDRSLVEVLTVNVAGAGDARQRLGRASPVGGLRSEVAGPGVVTFVWAGTEVGDDVVEAFVARVQPGVPATPTDLDLPYSWNGQSDRSMDRFLNRISIGRLLFDDVATVDVDGRSQRLVAGGDDAAVVQYWYDADEGDRSTHSNFGAVVPQGPPRPPRAGQRLTATPWPVPWSTVSLTITLDDGTTVTPQLVDARPTSDAKLAILPQAVTDRTVTSVSST